jgi:hypothetical protein
MSLDLSNEGVFATNRSHILDLVTLARRDETINLFQSWREKKLNNSSDEERTRIKFAASLAALFLELENELTRKWLEKTITVDLTETKQILIYNDEEPEAEQLLTIFFKISFILDQMNLTRRDKIQQVNYNNIEEVNKMKGL